MGYVLWEEKFRLWSWVQINTVPLRAFCCPPAQRLCLLHPCHSPIACVPLFQKLHLSEDVAGATFMAAGSSTPELFASVIGKDIRQLGHRAERARACSPVQWAIYQL